MKRFKMKKFLTLVLVAMMLVTSLPVSVLAEGETKLEPIRYLNDNVENLPVDVYKPNLPNGKTSEEDIKDPDMAKLYTARRDFKVRRGEDFVINYEPYIATVGEDATEDEKKKIEKTIPKPEFDGYTSPTPDQRTIKITYDKIKTLAESGQQIGNEYKGTKDYQYTPKRNKIKVKHVFQSLDDKSEYGRMDGSTDDIETEEWGETGSSITITPLEQTKRPGYVPEENEIITQIPEENANDIEIEYRYNRARYLVKFDSNGGSDVHSLNIFYGKTIPYNDEEPKKEGCGFVGWVTDTDITYGPANDKISAGTLITNKDKVTFTNADGTTDTVDVSKTFDGTIFRIKKDIETKGFVNAMPASDIVFKAHWKDKPKADYTIQYWAEKADYDDKGTNLALRDKYDFIGSYVVKDADTGSKPILKDIAEDNKGDGKGNITFPDLNDERLKKTQNDKNEFERYYFLNETLTEDANKVPDPDKPAKKVQKTVLATGETVYNVYYDRRVYTIYFTAAYGMAFDNVFSFWPTITRDGKVIGKEGAPYKANVRFNQSLDGIWPKDAEVSNLPPTSSDPDGDTGLLGWIINNNAGESPYRDTPPYRLSAEDFIDSQDVVGTDAGNFEGFGHADQIPIGENQTKAREKYEISIGSTSLETAVVHHIDIIKDDFEGKEQIDYDMSYWKSDTNGIDYDFILPHLQGFTLKEETRPAEWIYTKKINRYDKTFDELNAERNEKTPFRSDADKIEYIPKFPWGKKLFDGRNAYNYANYTRNKYKLKLNDDPKTIKNDNEYTDGKDRFDVFYEMPLKDLNLDTKNVPNRPAWVPADWEFKGWALDPAGENLVKDGNDIKLHYDQFLFAKWGEPDKKYTVKFDLNGGNTNYFIQADDIATHKAGESIETSLGKTKYVVPEKVADENNGSIKVFEVENRMNIREPKYNSYSLKPRREGYDFLGWERVRFIDNDPNKGEDDSYKKQYYTEELYAFGNEIISDVYLRAIWVPNQLVNINAYHHFLDLDYNEYEAGNEELIKLGETKSPYVQPLAKKRENKFMAAVASKQGENWYLIPKNEWDSLEQMNPVQGSKDYKAYIEEHKDTNGDYTRKNTYNQHGIVEPEFKDDGSKNPKFDSNDFHFYYRRFRQTKYRVNYIDVRGKTEIDNTIGNAALSKDQKETKIDELVEKYGIIASDYIVNGKSDYDARNYRHIPGWKLDSNRQQQLFFDLDAQGKLNGINGTGLDEVFFYYTDVRVIEVPKDDPVPDGYVRVTFKADKGGSFGNDKDGKPITELHYNVIKGLKSDLLVVPEELKGADKEEGKYYITPDNGKKFTKWDEKPLLNKNTIIENDTKDFYVFTAKFEWSGLSASGLVRTEAFIDPNGEWTNDFAPKIDDLKKQLEWKEKDEVEDLPAGTDIKFYDEEGNELKTDEDVFNLVNEKKAADKDELVRTVNVKAKVTFPDKKDPQELDIPITIYKNVYEALTGTDKPLFLSKAEQGELKNITGNYVKVTVAPTGDLTSKDNKVYYVNPKAWVEIPKTNLTTEEMDKLDHWSADIDAQNENGQANGVYDFTKRHKFKEDTVIAPKLVEKEIIPYDPDEPITRPSDKYVRVTFEADDGLNLTEKKAYYVKKTANIKLENLAKPGYDEKIGYAYEKWDKDDTLTIDQDTVVKALSKPLPEKIEKQNGVDKPKGYVEVNFTAGINGSLQGDKVYYVNPNKFVTLTPPTATGDTGYEFSNWDINPEIPRNYTDPVTTITASFNSIDAVSETPKPGYVQVDFVIDGNGGQIAKGEIKTYYVDPNRKVTLKAPTTVADVGYNFNTWTPNPKVSQAYKTPTTIKGTFSGIAPIIPATDGQGQENPKPNGYVTVTFDKGEHGTKIEGQTVYYVNPNARKTIGDLTRPKVEAEIGYKFTKWDKLDTKEITTDIEVSALYDKIDDIIPKTKQDDSEKPDGYITVSFSAEQNGKLDGTSVYFVNPNVAVALDKKAPTVIANTGYTFARWDTSIEKDIQYKDGYVIKALYNEPGNISTTEVAGYVKVEFKNGLHGTLTGDINLWIKPGVQVNLPEPTVNPNVGYKFDKWDKELSVTLNANDPTYVITAEYAGLDNVIPKTKDDDSEKPNGYVSVYFVSDGNGSLEGTTTYFVNPNVEVDLTDKADIITKKAAIGYTKDGGTWTPNITKKMYNTEETYIFNFVKLDDVIEDKGQVRPEGYVTVKLIPTASAKDETEKSYFVKANTTVTIPSTDPVGKEITDKSGTKYTFKFKLWTVTKGTIGSWQKGTAIIDSFIQDTDITAKYYIEAENITGGPVPKDDVVTAKGDVPDPKDLIKNIFDPKDPNNKNNLPDGTTFTYTNDGTPDVTNPGKTTAIIEVKYPDGKTTVVEVPITVADHVVPQLGGENGQKPLVPNDYIKVTVDTTDAATDNTKFVKVFWVKPNIEVTINDILAPTGKDVVEGGVTKTNEFVKWQLVGSDPEKFYETVITDTFVQDSRIVAVYEFNKNIEPLGKNDEWIPQGSNPSPKDFITNPYDDNDPNNPNNLPPRTKFEFVPGTEPDTQTPGTDKETKIKVIYPNGEEKELTVKYNVTGDVVEQPDPNDPATKPAVPNDFVMVTVKTTEKVVKEDGTQEEVEKATDDTAFVKVFWVNPEKEVTIPVKNPTGQTSADDTTWIFDSWINDANNKKYTNTITDQFENETTILAKYYKEMKPIVEPDMPIVKDVITEVGVEPTKDTYLRNITAPDGKTIEDIEIIKQANVSSSGISTAEIKVIYDDGTSATVTVKVFVKDRYVPQPSFPDVIYRDRVIEKEKIVEKIIKVKDNERLKEIRYMQGFNGYFRPYDGLRRSEAAQILANALKADGYAYDPYYPISYTDIGDTWYTEAVRIVSQAGVFQGYSDGTFKPEGKITRAEWVATLRRFQDLKKVSGNDMGLSMGHWATEEIEAAYQAGWLDVYTSGIATFDANAPITRQEVAAVSNKAFDRVLDKVYLQRNVKNMINYNDINPSMPLYEDILCASNTLLTDGRYYKANTIVIDNITFNIVTDDLLIYQKKFQFISH